MNFIREIFTFIRQAFETPPVPSIGDILQDKIDTHERGLISSEDQAGYHRKMAEYHRESLSRLRTQTHLLQLDPQPLSEARPSIYEMTRRRVETGS